MTVHNIEGFLCLILLPVNKIFCMKFFFAFERRHQTMESNSVPTLKNKNEKEISKTWYFLAKDMLMT